jgi:glycine/sarcosine N-methyltransferase
VSQVPLYDALAADYDRFVNWEGRLAHELPFFERLFGGQDHLEVLDAACGTGRHAIALARMGHQLVGTDLSSAMVEQAKENAAAAGIDVAFAMVGLGSLATLGKVFDAVLCLGNSLPHLLTRSAVDMALTDFAAVLRPGGLLVVQNRNFDQVCTDRERFMAPQSHQAGDDEWVFVRFYDFDGDTITFNMIRLRRTHDGWAQDVESTALRPIFRDDLLSRLVASGFGEVVCYGDYSGSAFRAGESGDLIVVAQRAP